MNKWIRIGLVVLSALMLTASFPRLDWNLLAWIALIPFFYALKDTYFWEGFGLGVLWGVVHFGSILYWVGYPVVIYAHMPMLAAIGAVFLLSLILSSCTGLFGGVCSAILDRPTLFFWGAPVFFLATEYIRSTFFSGFPWALLGASQVNQLRILQIADLFGVWGLTFLIVLGNAAIFLLIESYLSHGRTIGKGEKSVLMLIFVFPFLLAASIFYGNARIADIHAQEQTAPIVKTTILQGNIVPSFKWDAAHLSRSINTYIRLANSPAAKNADVVVLPETSMAFPLAHEKALWGLVNEWVFPANGWFVMGAPHWEEDNSQKQYFNSAFLTDPNGDVVDRYDKAHLVPFGEYSPPIPFGGTISLPGGSEFTSGVPARVMKTEKAVLGPQICYEIIFPQYSRQAVVNGADILVNLTEDGWYGDTAGPRQHFSLVILRAIENRRALVRAANTGFSGFVLPTGKVVGKTHLNEEATVMAGLPILTQTTLYQKVGDILPLACIVVLLGWTLVQGVLSIREKKW